MLFPGCKVFISYAHHDALDFTRRLAFALEMYMVVFWDIKLQAGKFPPQLDRHIEECDAFLAVMSPNAEREGGWCRQELRYAEKHNKKVVPVITPDRYIDSELGVVEYADFGGDFDAGFRSLTYLVVGTPYSSWEYLAHKEDDELLVSLERGQIPGLISKELGDWVIVDQLWPFLLEVLHEHRLVIGQPRTPDGVWRELQSLREQVAQEPDPAGLHVIDKIQPVIESYLDAVRATRDDNHIQASIATHTAIQVIEHMMLIEMTARGAVMRFIALQVRFKFNVAEKLRELITVHSRRSRYLY